MPRKKSPAPTANSPEPMTVKDVAALLGVTPPRISQLLAAGAIPRRADGLVDPLPAAIAMLTRARSDAAGRAVKERYLRAQSVAAEARLRRELSQLLELDQAAKMLEANWTRMIGELQAVGARCYYDVKLMAGEPVAYRVANHFHREMLAALHAAKAAGEAALRDARAERLSRDSPTVDRLYCDLVAAVETAGDGGED
jgi:hypothetical protein